MPSAFDASGNPIDVAPDALAGQWQAGAVHLDSAATYHVRVPSGKVLALSGADPGLPRAIADGGEFISSDEAAQVREQARYGGIGGKAAAFGAGALEQGTLGLGEHLLPDSAKEYVGHAQAANPLSTMLGQGVGMAGLGLATGALGDAAGLGGALEGGVGGAVERGVAGALGEGAESLGARMAARAAVQGARGVAEGAQFGTARAIGENAIAPEDHPLTAASILATVGGDALWGGALGAGMGVLGEGMSRLLGRSASTELAGATQGAESAAGAEGAPTKLDKALGDLRSPAPDDVAAVAGKVAGAEPAEGLGAAVKKYYTKLASAASGASEGDLDAFTGGMFDEGSVAYENRKALLEADELRANAAREIKSHVDDILGASREVMEEGERGLKRGHIARAVEGVDGELAAKASTDAVSDTLQTLQKMRSAPQDFGAPLALEHAETVAGGLATKLNAAVEKGDIAEQFGLLDDLKKAIGKYTKGASRLSPAGATDELIALQNKARAAELQGLYERLRTSLEDEGTWKQAAVDQKTVNQAWTRQIEASDRFHRALTTEVGRDPNNPWQTIRGVDPAKADSYVKNLTNPSQDLTHKAVVDYVQSTRDLAGAMREQWELPPAKLAAVDRLSGAADAFASTLDRTTKSLSLANQFDAIRHATTGHAMGWLGAAGAMAHGLPGGVAGMALGKIGSLFTEPAQAIMQLARVEGMVRRSDGRIGRAVRGFLRGTGRATPEALPLAAYERKASQVRALVGDPAELQRRAAANVGALGVRSPKLAAALTRTSVTGLAFLQSKLPPEPPRDILDPDAVMPPPPPGQRESWLRYYRAVKDPNSVFDDLHAGRLSPEGIEVLKTVYPPLYERGRAMAMDELASGRGKDMTKQQRIGMALLWDLPTPELNPAYIRERQAAYAPPQPQDNPSAQGSGPPGQSRRSKPVDLTITTSPADRVESGSASAEH